LANISPVRWRGGDGILIVKSSAEVVLARIRPFTSGVKPRVGFPGVDGGKLWFSVLAGTRGEKFWRPGREYRAEERKMFRGVEATPEKLVDFGMTLAGASETDADMEEKGLLGLSPGIRRCVAMLVEVGRGAISDAEMLWESLLDGACGRPIILREAICDSDARFTGL